MGFGLRNGFRVMGEKIRFGLKFVNNARYNVLRNNVT